MYRVKVVPTFPFDSGNRIIYAKKHPSVGNWHSTDLGPPPERLPCSGDVQLGNEPRDEVTMSDTNCEITVGRLEYRGSVHATRTSMDNDHLAFDDWLSL